MNWKQDGSWEISTTVEMLRYQLTAKSLVQELDWALYGVMNRAVWLKEHGFVLLHLKVVQSGHSTQRDFALRFVA